MINNTTSYKKLNLKILLISSNNYAFLLKIWFFDEHFIEELMRFEWWIIFVMRYRKLIMFSYCKIDEVLWTMDPFIINYRMLSIFPLQNRLGLKFERWVLSKKKKKFERWVVCNFPGGVVGPTKLNESIGCDKMNQNQPVIPADSKRTVW